MKNKVVVVVGGTSGIGFDVAQQAAAAGARVILGGRDPQRLQACVAQLGTAASGYLVDMADLTSINQFFAEISHIDFLFTPGSSYNLGKFSELSDEDAQSPMAVKFWGQYRAVKAALPKIATDGAIVLMSGALGARVMGIAAAYAACNSAIETLGRSLAQELAPIRVNTVSPGTINSDLWQNRPAPLREAAFEHYSGISLAGRVGEVAEVTDAVLFLFKNHFINGSTLYVDGGFVLK